MRRWTQSFEPKTRENVRINEIFSPSGDQEERDAEAVLTGLRNVQHGDLICTMCSRITDYGSMLADLAFPYYTCECGQTWVLAWRNEEIQGYLYSFLAWERARPEP